MNGDRIAMSARERDRLKVMAPVVEGQRTVEFEGHVTYFPCRTWPGRPVRACRRGRAGVSASSSSGRQRTRLPPEGQLHSVYCPAKAPPAARA